MIDKSRQTISGFAICVYYDIKEQMRGSGCLHIFFEILKY